MVKNYNVLAINPGSTSTKITVYQDELLTYGETIRHSPAELGRFSSIIEQLSFRKKLIMNFLQKADINFEKIDAIVGRGGLLKPLQGGTYAININMIKDLKKEIRGSHASNLGAILADEIAREHSKPSFIVDPVVVDEMIDIARITGWPELKRQSLFHALNQKAVARRVAVDFKRSITDCSFIVAHLGGGISVGAHLKGRVIDVNNALDGEGPFSPERSGTLPIGDVVKICFSNQYELQEIQKKIVGKGGLMAYFDTSDARDVENLIEEGDKKAQTVYEAMAFQVAKTIGSMATVLKGNVDAIILTGGLTYGERFVNLITDRVKFIAPLIVYPGEDEMLALTQGALRVLKGEEVAKEYN